MFDRDDQYHLPIVDFLKQFEGRLITSWSVLTEVMYMLDFNVQVQLDCLSWIEQDAVRLYPLKKNDIPRIIEVTKKYSHVPMDLTDAILMIISEMNGWEILLKCNILQQTNVCITFQHML